MEKQEREMLEILQSNNGFAHPDRWLAYGIEHNFKKVQTDKLDACPDCESRSFDAVGQYVYYCTLVNLRACAQCGLVFADTRIDPQVILSHFEEAYKDEAYFNQGRRRIFRQIAGLVDRLVPHAGKILDIGGAKGHLLATIRAHRPDLTGVLNDLSTHACEYAASEYGFQTIVGGVDELDKVSIRFEAVIMSDVLYYETDLRRFWTILPRLVSEDGAVIIRVSNKLALIRFWQFIRRAMVRRKDRQMQDDIRFHNPEQLYVFSRRYLLTRLKSIGFSQVTAIPSELPVGARGKLWRPAFFLLCKLFWFLSFGSLLITPSMIVVARRHSLTRE
ncbi:MAG: methyltransferase domain-containing protein [candidate division Zixibacteria bacterium]|nr:methyltransferase domain-containing protein [candidate division Zixibacteria bacterium]